MRYDILVHINVVNKRIQKIFELTLRESASCLAGKVGLMTISVKQDNFEKKCMNLNFQQ